MPKWLAIAAYRNEFDGAPGGSIDIRVLGFDLETEDEVRAAISNEPVVVYENDQGEQVSWNLAQVLAVEEFAFHENAEELIGFIAESEEFKTWAYK
jgi:hypothetical protein